MKPRIRLHLFSATDRRMWECGIVGVGRSPDEAYRSWEVMQGLRPPITNGVAVFEKTPYREISEARCATN